MADTEQSVGFLVSDVARMLRANFNRRAQGLGLSQAQWRALAYLWREEGINQVTLAERLEIQPITLARLIDRLQEAGLVDRRPDPSDRRAFLLHLTPQAQPLIEELFAFAHEVRDEALAGIPDRNVRIMMDTLERMKRNLLEAERRPADAAPGQAQERSNVAGKA